MLDHIVNMKLTCDSTKYKVRPLVANVEGIARHVDTNLCGSGGIAVDLKHTIWVANQGNSLISANVSRYDRDGNTVIEKLPFIDYASPSPLVPPSEQRQLISDLLWLQKVVVYERGLPIMSMPKIYTLPPILGTIIQQPSSYEISLDTFMNAPNGYLGPDVEISYLINFCINNPLPLRTPAGRQATVILQNAHYITYKKLITEPFNSDLITIYGAQLMEAQKWIELGASVITKPLETTPTASVSSSVVKFDAQVQTFNDQLPIGLVYNKTKGFVGYQLNAHRASCDLIAVSSNGSIYSYSPLINTDEFYGFITVLNNSENYPVYTGIALAENRIFITDLANRRIEVYDFGWISLRAEDQIGFTDPDLPDDYSPFGIMTHNNHVYVSYAKWDPAGLPQGNKILSGSGYGYINMYTLDGVLVKRLVSNGPLNAPWSMIVVHNEFVAGRFLVANHGDGRILMYDENWNYLGRLKYTNYGRTILGLYGIAMMDQSLYFVSEPYGVGGLLGRIKKKHTHKHHHKHHDHDHDHDHDTPCVNPCLRPRLLIPPPPPPKDKHHKSHKQPKPPKLPKQPKPPKLPKPPKPQKQPKPVEQPIQNPEQLKAIMNRLKELAEHKPCPSDTETSEIGDNGVENSSESGGESGGESGSGSGESGSGSGESGSESGSESDGSVSGSSVCSTENSRPAHRWLFKRTRK
jgi:uncharacterized protein (TIGR03118 family)